MTDKIRFTVEAALFSAGRPISVEEIQERTGLRKQETEKALKELSKDYKERDTALEVGKAGTKWAMQVRSRASDDAAKFAPMEIPKKVLKTLALIAYHQPMKQSDLKDMIGSKVYDHVGELKERGLIKTRRDGITKIITTTAAFPEYFGLEAADQYEVRTKMAELVGLPPPEKVKRPKDEQLTGFDALVAEAEQHVEDAPMPESGVSEAAEVTDEVRVVEDTPSL